MTSWHFASIWEAIADAIPDAPALACGEVRRSWRAFEERGARIASALERAGVGRGAKVGLYASNCNEYLEAQFGIFKASACPINVNYRYSEAELVYLLDNAEAEAVFFDARFAARVAAIRDQLPRVKLLVAIDDGSDGALDEALGFDALIAANAPLPRRSQDEDDIYMLYTGGTTGMPKGVMMRQGDFSKAVTTALAVGLRGLATPERVEDLVGLVRELHAAGDALISLPACPLMHGTGAWGGAFGPHALGGLVVTVRGDHFDPDVLWRAVDRERVSDLVIVGDAFAKPMLVALRAASDAGQMPDLSHLKRIISSGVMFSREVKAGLLELADVTIIDVMGSTEGGMGSSVVSRADPPGETARFMPSPGVKVFDALDREVTPGTDEIGMVASAGGAQLGYYKDEAKTAATFRTIDGVRYSFPGDFARIAADGSLILLGRGSVCINTGGEKVFPEEVEEAFKAHPDVFDCLVVGVPDPRFGERVTAVLSLRDGRCLDEPALLDFARTRVAGYKLPRRLVVVGEVQRAPNGKADYKWAKSTAIEASAEPVPTVP
jgi:acyl-CoA synthetase (AMP-forming)/AMP-acid ligase II